MASNLEKLLILQERDRRIAQLKQEYNDIPARKQHIEDQLQQFKEAVEKAQDDLKHQKAAVKSVELEVEQRHEKIAKYRQQQFQIKSNDEYRALEGEIKTIEAQIAELEDQELEIMEKAEDVNVVIKERESEVKDRQNNIQGDLDALEQRIKSIDAEMKELEAERAKLAPEVDADWLARYERIIRRDSEGALFPVEVNNCGACHMQVPVQIVYDAKNPETMTFCPYCQRMLYFI